MDITLPSGLRGRIRKLKTKDANKVAQGGRRDAAVRQTSELLAACWEETLDLGPYEGVEGVTRPDGGINWDRVLVGDRYALLVYLRRATHGDIYPFGVSCPARDCRVRFEWEVNLEDVPVTPLSEEDRAAFTHGNRITAEVAGTQVAFKLPTGQDEIKSAKQANKFRDRRLTFAIMMRLLDVDGVEPGKLRDWVEDLDLDQVDELFDVMQAHDCGVETAIEVECQDCGERFEVDLPFDQNFMFPKSQGTGKRRRQRHREL